MSLEKGPANKTFGGELAKYSFKSEVLGDLKASFNLFLPEAAVKGEKVPLLIYLAGLTCTEDTGAQKGGFLRDAADEGLAILFPDTSPRGAGIEGEDKDWDFGTGAGFYIDATNPTYAKYYNMYTHITQELPAVIGKAGVPIDFTRMSIFGHSMGGHGALIIYLKSKGAFRSVSAFSPICNPTECNWGKKAFSGYLKGGVEEAKGKYDATDLIATLPGPFNILIDYGTADQFLKDGQLLPENLTKAWSEKSGHDDLEVKIRAQDGYDHSYYFISTFARDHIQFHARALKA